jgi:chromate transporter
VTDRSRADFADSARPERGGVGEVFVAFLRLGLTSFGGPVAHIGYFRDELVTRRRWIDEAGYADLVALCQLLPGPASSQVGFSLGVLRAGSLLGGGAAWLGFTLPSALLLFAFGAGAATLNGPLAGGVLHGLKLVAVAVVAQAVWGMAGTLAPDRVRAAVAVAAIGVVTVAGSVFGQLLALALGAVVGLIACRGGPSAVSGHLRSPVSRTVGAMLLVAFGLILVAAPILAAATHSQTLNLFAAFYRSGALVFGGGHVVLPLLQAQVVAPGWVSNDTFLAGYGLAQAAPGPLFAFAAYLGAVMALPPNGLAGSVIALIAVFLPGLLLVAGLLPFWDRLRGVPAAEAAMRGANAAVVGILAAALYDPVWTSAVLGPVDFALAACGFVLLTVWRTPPIFVVLLLAGAGGVLAIA